MKWILNKINQILLRMNNCKIKILKNKLVKKLILKGKKTIINKTNYYQKMKLKMISNLKAKIKQRKIKIFKKKTKKTNKANQNSAKIVQRTLSLITMKISHKIQNLKILQFLVKMNQTHFLTNFKYNL